jgi:dienelactone hydrolase
VPFAADNPALRALVLYYATITDDAATELRPRHTFQTAGQVKCPTLVLYGGNDFVTSIEMQFRLWQSFVEGGTPVEWHYFATGTHGFANPDSEEYQPDREQLATHLVFEFLARALGDTRNDG